jgi:hypothetical protein
MEETETTQDRIELLVLERQGLCIALAKARTGNTLARKRDHVWGHVNSNNGRTASQGLRCQVSCSRSDLQQMKATQRPTLSRSGANA